MKNDALHKVYQAVIQGVTESNAEHLVTIEELKDKLSKAQQMLSETAPPKLATAEHIKRLWGYVGFLMGIVRTAQASGANFGNKDNEKIAIIENELSVFLESQPPQVFTPTKA